MNIDMGHYRRLCKRRH